MKINCFLLALALLNSLAVTAQTTYTLADTALAKRYMEEAKVLMDSAKYDAALGKLDTAGVILEGTVGREDTSYAKVLYGKGSCLNEKGFYDLAIEYHQKALETRIRKLGIEHLDVAASYHNLGIVYGNKGDYDSELEYYQKALEIFLKKLGPEHPNVATSYINLGFVYGNKGDYDLALEYYQKALEIFLKKLGPEHPNVGFSYGGFSAVYNAKGDYDRALEYIQKALEIRLKILGPEHPDMTIDYHTLGSVYGAKGDYDRAIECHLKALEIRLKILGPEHPDVADSYHGLAYVYHAKGEYDPALEYFQKALEVRLKKLGPEHPRVATTYNNLGMVYKNKGDYDLALEYYQKALKIFLKKLGPEHPHAAAPYNNLGAVYWDKCDYDLALEYYQKAFEIHLKKLGPEHPYVAFSYKNIGFVYIVKGDYDRAIEYFQKALKIRLEKLGSAHPDVTGSYNNLGLAYKSNGKYTIASDYFNKALLSVNAFRKTLENPASKSTLSKESAGVYEGGIAVNHLLHQHTDSLHYLHESFTYAEQSKALSLYESMKNAEALRFAGIPDSLLQQEYDLRVDIAYNEKRKQGEFEKGKEETDSTVLKISSKLFDLKRTYEQLTDTFEIRYPDYFRLKYDFRTVDVASIQRDLLPPDQAMLMYHVGDSSVFIFLLKKDDYRVVEVKKDFPLEDWAQQMRHGIYGYRMDSLQHDTLPAFAAGEYTGAAWRLYQKLLAPVDSLLPRRVVIVPDGVLGYVPFEALLTQKPAMPHRFQTHPYFFKEHDLSYCYSATLLREMKQRQHRQKPLLNVTGFAPFFHGEMASQEGTRNRGGGWDTLPQSGQEVYRIVKMMGGLSFLGKEASKEAFLRTAGQGRILHLATHGKSDDKSGDRSFLVFFDDTLYVRDIYNLSLDADLVTLSACETGVGELQRGEGIISLARAFSYAGAKSIVTTLWSVDDARTKDLMIAFYQNLKDGMTKDAALAEARRGFLKTPFAHPFYWAGFVGIGDMGEVGSGQ